VWRFNNIVLRKPENGCVERTSSLKNQRWSLVRSVESTSFRTMRAKTAVRIKGGLFSR